MHLSELIEQAHAKVQMAHSEQSMRPQAPLYILAMSITGARLRGNTVKIEADIDHPWVMLSCSGLRLTATN
jgi:hypothetical protein